MPHRSRGCLLCRSRKIRCDLARPSCIRCTTHGVTCPGYRTETPFGAEFRDETSKVIERAQEGQKLACATSSSTTSTSFRLPCCDQGQGSIVKQNNTKDRGSATRSNPLAVSSIIELRSPRTHRVQLYDTYCSIYMPRQYSSTSSTCNDPHFDCIRMLMADSACHPALQRSLDALSLVQIGSAHKDQQYLHKAREAYVDALRCLSVHLYRPDIVYNDQILAAVKVLSTCELYDEIKGQGQGWMNHLQGLRRLLDARGPESLKSPLAVLLLFQSIFLSTNCSLLLHQSDHYAAPRWQSLLNKHDHFLGSYRLALRITTLLERYDKVMNSDGQSSFEELDCLISDCQALHCEMKDYYEAQGVCCPTGSKSIARLVSINEFKFARLISNRTLSVAYQFRTFTNAYLTSQYLQRMYMLLSAIQSLRLIRSQRYSEHLSDFQDTPAKTKILEHVLAMCRCIPFFIEPFNGATGNICCFMLLHLATQHFRNHGLWTWLIWAMEVKDRAFDKGISMPQIGSDAPSYEKHPGEIGTSWLA